MSLDDGEHLQELTFYAVRQNETSQRNVWWGIMALATAKAKEHSVVPILAYF